MLRRILVLFIFSCFLGCGRAEAQPGLDSLKFKLSNASGKDELQLLIEIMRKLRIAKPAEALPYAERALKISKETGNRADITTCLNLIGRVQYNLSNYSAALGYYTDEIVIRAAMHDDKGLAGAYMNLGECYRQMGTDNEAFENYLKGLKLYEKLNDTRGISTVYNNMGILYKNRKDFPHALEYYDKSYKMAVDTRDTQAQVMANHNIATVYMMRKDYTKAIEYYKKALEAKRKSGHKIEIASTLNNLAIAYLSLKDYKKASDLLDEALATSESANDNLGILFAYLNMGELQAKMGKTDEALKLDYKSLPIAREVGNKTLIDSIYRDISSNAAKKRDYVTAYEYHVKYAALKDSIDNSENQKQLGGLQARFDTEQKDKQIKLLEKDSKIEKLWRNTLLFTFMAVLIIGFLLVYNLVLRSRKNKELLEKNTRIYEKDQALAKAEIERSQIAQTRMEQELDFRARQLTTHALNIIQKNKLMEELRENINEVIKKTEPETAKELSHLNRMVNYSFSLDEDWEDFKLYFEKIHVGFFDKLKETYPDLSAADLKLCALIRLKLSMKESATILNISPGSVKTARYRLRQKLGIQTEDDLPDFLMKF